MYKYIINIINNIISGCKSNDIPSSSVFEKSLKAKDKQIAKISHNMNLIKIKIYEKLIKSVKIHIIKYHKKF